GCTVSPRKSRKKSLCFSRTMTGTPSRPSRYPSITPAGPPPAIQQVVSSVSIGILFSIDNICGGTENDHHPRKLRGKARHGFKVGPSDAGGLKRFSWPRPSYDRPCRAVQYRSSRDG